MSPAKSYDVFSSAFRVSPGEMVHREQNEASSSIVSQLTTALDVPHLITDGVGTIMFGRNTFHTRRMQRWIAEEGPQVDACERGRAR
jgi:hypothetical protein